MILKIHTLTDGNNCFAASLIMNTISFLCMIQIRFVRSIKLFDHEFYHVTSLQKYAYFCNPPNFRSTFLCIGHKKGRIRRECSLICAGEQLGGTLAQKR